jgi:ADP-ribosylglycohydrolase
MAIDAVPPQFQSFDSAQRLTRARLSLEGTSVGDAFGEQFFNHSSLIDERILPPGPWHFTDDTIMTISIVDVLEEKGVIDQGVLADLFARRYTFDPTRGYGGTAHGILQKIASGLPWETVSKSVFGGTGSAGNGAAMRAAPVGAYFADDYTVAAEQARLSAAVTHGHPEGQAGAIAVALCAACVARGGIHAPEIFDVAIASTPDSETRAKIVQASSLSLRYDVRTAAAALGNGTEMTAQDTVPFCIWCVARQLHDFEEALWTTVSGLGDRDTTCAIVGGILAVSPSIALPSSWLSCREPLSKFSRTNL